MPTDRVVLHNGADGKPGYRAHFSHENEKAAPGYYSVKLDSTNIHVELTTTSRAGMHKYQYPSPENQYLILDLEHRDKLLSGAIEKVNDYELRGHRFSEAWAKDQRLFFHIKYSHPLLGDIGLSEALPYEKKAALQFDNPNNEPIYISVGISAVDAEGAQNNLETEIGSKSFETLRSEANEIWERQLEKIIVESPSIDDKTNFYTALYHTSIAPNLYSDADGRYRGMDLEIHETEDFDYYTVFSLWDTYRATHPLFTLIEQNRTTDFIKTFLAKYEEGGILPIWDLAANYTGCMIGYHSVPVIADAYLKGIQDYDVEKAFEAIKHSAEQSHLGLASYKSLGFIPVEEESESVSKTLEYAYDDWTISQMAKAMGKSDDYARFIKRAQFYKNVFDPKTGFMRGRFRNSWFSPFDPFEVNFNYTEANAWQYSLYVPQDISGLMQLMGGKEALNSHLDELFSAESETSGRDQADITGLIGQYAHGNEPSHHMAYLYNFVNKPSKTQEKVREIMKELYTNNTDGISGNEDCGQMSAWYVFSSLGFYPVTPGSNEYIIGSPLVEKASINMENGKCFTVDIENYNENHPYIQSVQLNGKVLNRSFLKHSEIMAGGNLEFLMGPQPSDWGTADGAEPKTAIEDDLITPAPFIDKGEVAFRDSTQVSLEGVGTSTIYYRLNNGEFHPYKEPFSLNEDSTLEFYAENERGKSEVLQTQFYKVDPNRSIELFSEYANQYNGGGPNALIDGIKGARDFRTGAWQGYQGTDVEFIVDLGELRTIQSISVSFLEDQRSWIFFPTEVKCWTSDQKNGYFIRAITN